MEPNTEPRPDAPSTFEAALAGLAAAAVGLGAAELVAGVDQGFRSPVLAVGDRVVDRVPGWLKDLAIEWFGTQDKIALLVGIGVVLAIVAAGTGVLTARRGPRWAGGGVALIAVVGAAAAIGDRSGTRWLAGLPSLVGGVAAGAALLVLLRYRGQRAGAAIEAGDTATRAWSAPSSHPGDRRRFLFGLAAATVGAGALAAGGRRLQQRFDAAPIRAALSRPRPSRPQPPPPTAIQVDGAAPFFTPNQDFYRIDTALTVPQVDPDDWTLSLRGMVDRPIELTYRELTDRALVEQDVTLTCVSNTIGGGLVGTARWIGVPLDDLLAEAGVDPRADQIVGRSVDGYTCGFPVAAIDGRPALVAIGMNGELLPLEHGFPARLVVSGIYGYASATKWLREIELTTFDAFDHYWVPRGYSTLAPIKLQSRIDTPRGLDRRPPGPTAIAGVAWAQPVGIGAVEIRIDGGPWLRTVLAEALNAHTWRQWSVPWEATPGRHTIEVRAVDANGAIQTPDRSEPLPNGATGHHTVVVLVADR